MAGESAQSLGNNDLPSAEGFERHIGRRTFITLMAAGLLVLFGRALISRLPPGLKVGGFVINSVAAAPRFEANTWRLSFDGLVRKPLRLTFAEYLALPQTAEARDFYCVDGWGVGGVHWTGVTLRDLMTRSDVDPRATHLVFHSGDGIYTDSLTINEAMQPDVLLVHLRDGDPLSMDQGLPVRLVVPGSWGYKSVKWVVRVEAITVGPGGYQGYWENRGYPANASIH
jgi:methionine sulfoxide reductase catalytic subunit